MLRARELVYVLEGGGLVKIGVTTDLAGRLKAHQASSPVPLGLVGIWATVYGVNGYEVERALHGAFAAYRTHGEWFDIPPDLRAAFFKDLRRATALDFMELPKRPLPEWATREMLAAPDDLEAMLG